MMSDQLPGPDEPQIDVATVTRDELLLNALGRGDPPPAGDDIAVLLAAWRADLAADPPAGDPLPGGAPVPGGVAVELRRGAVDAPVQSPHAGKSRIGARFGSRTRGLVAAAAAMVALAGGLAAAAGGAGPESPLWPITRLMYEERADSRIAQRDAEDALARARRATTEARYDDAAQLLDEAAALIDRIRDPRVAERLRAEVAAVRGLLPGAVPILPSGAVPSVPPAATPRPGASGGMPSSGAPADRGRDLAPSPTDELPPGLPLPSLPSLPLPSLPGPSLPGPSDLLD